jgi:hypothetical protein
MGITIYYKGTLTDIKRINDITSEVKDICQIMKWKFQELDDDWSLPIDGALDKNGKHLKITGDLGLKGIGFQPHKDSEWLNLYFDNKGIICTPLFKAMYSNEPDKVSSFNGIKTQFAPVHTHITVVKLLRHLKNKYIHDLEVIDDGGYWETDNVEKLESARNSIFGAMDKLENALGTFSGKSTESMSPEEIVDYIENVSRERFDGRDDSKT